MKISTNQAEQIVKRMFFLAYEACGRPIGMGVFQERYNATEEDVWHNVKTQGDYPGRNLIQSEPNTAYGDYVFGRMMKMSIKFDENSIELPESTPRLDYQSWSRNYKSYQALYDAAVQSLQ